MVVENSSSSGERENSDLDLGWDLLDAPAGYNVAQLGLSKGERRVLQMLLEMLLQNPARDSASLLRRLCEEKGILLEKTRASKIIECARHSVQGLGVLDFLLDDDDLEEISVIGAGKPIYVFHRAKGWLETNALFTSEEHAVDTINKIARPLGRRITFQNPRLNAFLPDGSRLHASISPVCLNGVELTIRKFRKSPLHAKDLCDNGTFSLDALAFLWTVLYADVSLCVAGNTGSGKTTTLNALFSFIPLGERVVVTEDTPELSFPHGHLVKIVANEENGIPLKELVKDTLRMRPDRIVIGEVRTQDDAAALFDSLLAGQAKGSCFTFHSNSALEAMQRFKAFGIAPQDLNAIDLVVVQKRISLLEKKTKALKEVRRVWEIAEIADSKPRTLFYLNKNTKRLEKTSLLARSPVVERVLLNYDFTTREFWDEVARRREFLKSVEPSGFEDFTAKAQSFAFGKNTGETVNAPSDVK